MSMPKALRVVSTTDSYDDFFVAVLMYRRGECLCMVINRDTSIEEGFVSDVIKRIHAVRGTLFAHGMFTSEQFEELGDAYSTLNLVSVPDTELEEFRREAVLYVERMTDVFRKVDDELHGSILNVSFGDAMELLEESHYALCSLNHMSEKLKIEEEC